MAITLRKDDWRLGDDRLLRVRVRDTIGEDMTGATATLTLYDPDGTEAMAAAAMTVSIETVGTEKQALCTYQLAADDTVGGTGDITSAGRWRAEVAVTLDAETQTFVVPLQVLGRGGE